MKIKFVLIILLAVACFIVPTKVGHPVFGRPALAGESSLTKVDPMLRIMAADSTHAVKTMKAFGAKSIGGRAQTDVMIKSENSEESPAAARQLIEELGGSVRSVIGSIMTATIPFDAISALESSDDIQYIEAAKPVRFSMQYARTTSGVASVQSGAGTGGTAYTGSGVIVGVVDSGIDCEHADFKNANGTTRILAYWDQSISGGSGVSEISNSSGTEYTGTALSDDGACTNSPDQVCDECVGHGTHVAGIAAGRDSTFKGVAYSANLVVVKLEEPSVSTLATSYSTYITSLSTNVVDAVNYIFKKAQAAGEPAVVNLSIGTSLGAHDATSLFESGLDALLIESGTTEKEGRAIVNAAGNENAALLNDTNAGGIHADIDVVASTPKAFEILTPYTSGYDPVGGVGGTWIDIWLDSSSSCTIAINAYNKTKTILKKSMSAVAKGSSNKDSPVTDGTVSMYLDFSDSSNSLNGRQHAIGLIYAATSSKLANYSFDLAFDGTCTGDAWLYYDYVYNNLFTKGRAASLNPTADYTYVDGDSNSTITIPATANRVIAVGSFMDRATWVDKNGTSHSQETATKGTASDISSFSSLGPTTDGTGRTKPELAAPGEPIISTLASTASASSSNKGDATHHKLEGTSMASPHVAGTVALMLEKNGCLKAADIKSALTGTTDTDTYTGYSLPDNTWGYGKLDAAAAVNNVTADSSCTPDNTSDETDGSSSSSTASSGCSSSLISKSPLAPLYKRGGWGDLMSVFVAFLPIFLLLLVHYGTTAYKKSRSKQNF